MKDLDLFPNADLYSHISDEPIGDREAEQKGHWHLTTPELGCALSHYLIWCQAARSPEPTLILEHDAVLISPIPKIPADVLAVNYQVADDPGTVGYVITPTAANLAIARTRKHGVEPSDELLWRSTLKGLPVRHEPQPVIAIEDEGISTIQWTRTDDVHAAISKHDPWAGFNDPSAKNTTDI
jgi:GR25 family glycosyltransferase involved in LPS biosynthesis